MSPKEALLLWAYLFLEGKIRFLPLPNRIFELLRKYSGINTANSLIYFPI
jgi:hypothetical protein